MGTETQRLLGVDSLRGHCPVRLGPDTGEGTMSVRVYMTMEGYLLELDHKPVAVFWRFSEAVAAAKAAIRHQPRYDACQRV